ncbi:MAG: peptidyl-prolyl cis-trans isomerase [Burkholderiales bacterium]|jgi:peptidyl-prolyl cis-trans isomerase B (cyclophilin B)|nr:peptidyl-prolyl cis-trans isomerase [Burkholderiales bacterium]
MTFLNKASDVNVRVETSEGTFTLALSHEHAPKTVENFLAYVKDGHYNGTIFHRVISNFMVQGGGYQPGMKEKKTRKPIENEAQNKLSNTAYTIAMARTNEPHSATAQFFINVVDNPFLDFKSATPQGWGYAVFGKVIDGTEVIDKIKMKPTGSSGFHDDVPKEDVVIVNVSVVE